MSSRAAIREQILSIRQGLSEHQQAQAMQDLRSQAETHDVLHSVSRVALYLSVKGELNTASLIELCWERNIEVYLPVIHPFCKGHLLFLRYTPTSPMITNKYGIEEPALDVTKVLPATELDIILTPLVAFDDNGNRLGMGGGYYDRTLANVDNTKCKVIGLAHEEQKVAALDCESWDIPLPYVLTPKRLYKF